MDHNSIIEQISSRRNIVAIKNQIQRLSPGQDAVKVDEMILEHSVPTASGVLNIYVASLTCLAAVARHRKRLDVSFLDRLVDMILLLSQDRDNLCTNRESLLHSLTLFADAISPEARRRSLAILQSLASGVDESLQYPTAEAVDNPLNSLRFHTGRPEEVQSMALIALAEFHYAEADSSRNIDNYLEIAICDPRPDIRRAGYAAAQRLQKISEVVLLGLLAGLRDSDPNVASSAFAAITRAARTERNQWKLKRSHWQVFFMAVRSAQSMGNAKLRMHAAAALFAWSKKCPPALRGCLISGYFAIFGGLVR